MLQNCSYLDFEMKVLQTFKFRKTSPQISDIAYVMDGPISKLIYRQHTILINTFAIVYAKCAANYLAHFLNIMLEENDDSNTGNISHLPDWI